MTYGEQWYAWKCKINSFETKFDDVDTQRRLCKKMGRVEAMEYNNAKCRKVFEGLGFEYKKRDNFEERLKLVMFKVRSQSNKMIKREARANSILYNDYLKVEREA